LPKAGILAQKFKRRMNVEPCTNVQSKPFSPTFGNTLLSAGGFSPANLNRSTVIFYFLMRRAKFILIDNQRFIKYFKNNCLKIRVSHIPYVYLYQQNEIIMQVTSKTFGTGTLISQDVSTVQVDFNGVVKNLLIKYANLTLEDGSIMIGEDYKAKKVVKVKKVPLPKIDYSKYSDAELVQMHNELMGDLIEAKSEARKDLKTGTR